MKRKFLILSWSLYDLANQFFALNIVSLYFPRWLTIEKKSPEILYGLTFGISMFFVAICAPVMGAISDITKRHKVYLIYFTLLSIIFTMAMGLSSNLFLGLLFFAIANFGCQGAVVFYNALMVNIAPKSRIGFVSGLGRMFGYCGAILALYITKPVILNFGYQATFFVTGILFLIFSLPCMIFIKEETLEKKMNFIYFLKKQRLLEIFGWLKATIFDSHKSNELRNFLKAAFFGLGVVNAVILFMSVYITKVFGLNESEIINVIAFSTIFAILGSIFSGYISDIIGCRVSFIGVYILWAICILGGGLLGSQFLWLVGALVGVSLGATWVISRALLIKLVPHEKIGEVFGLFNLVGYVSGIIGPLFLGTTIFCFSTLGQAGYRLSFLSQILFIAVGMVFLLRMSKEKVNIT